MSYDTPNTINYTFPGIAFGAGTVTRKIRVPRGASQARVLDINMFATVVFTQVTTAARVQVGIAGTLGKYADMNVGGLAANAALNFADNNGARLEWNKATDAVQELTVTFVAPTGGSPTGTADVQIAIAWDSILARAP